MDSIHVKFLLADYKAFSHHNMIVGLEHCRRFCPFLNALTDEPSFVAAATFTVRYFTVQIIFICIPDLKIIYYQRSPSLSLVVSTTNNKPVISCYLHRIVRWAYRLINLFLKFIKYLPDYYKGFIYLLLNQSNIKPIQRRTRKINRGFEISVVELLYLRHPCKE